MSDTIKYIEEVLESMPSPITYKTIVNQELALTMGCWVIAGYPEIKAALTVLQKIASGDDWLDIETAPDGFILGIEDDGDMQVCWRKDKSFLRSGDVYDYVFNPKKWKHIDGAKHIKMMMERELNK